MGRAIQVLINNGDGTFHDESGQRLGFQEDTGNSVRYVYPIDTNGNCSRDIFPEFNASEVRIYTNDGTGHFARQTSGLPNIFYVPHPIDINNTGQISFIYANVNGFHLVPVISGSGCIPVVLASVQCRHIRGQCGDGWCPLYRNPFGQ